MEKAGIIPYSISHCSEVADKLAHLLLVGSHSDVTFVVGGEQFHAHRLILALQSEYFNRLLYGHMREALPGAVVVMESTSADAFRLLLHYAYCGNISIPTEEMELALELLGLADMCGLLQLKKALGDLIIQEMVTPHNLLMACLHLELHGAKEAHTKCVRAMDDHAPKVLASEAFLQLSRDHLCEILSRDSFFANEVAILHAVGKWLHSNNEKPEDALNEALLQCIRVTQIDPAALESDGDQELFLRVRDMKSSKCAQWNEYPRGILENEALVKGFETFSPADITVATQNVVSCKASQPAMERPLLASELLDNSPSAATLLAFREQYLISCFEFHCYHSHQHRRSPDPGLNICNKPISYRLEASTDVLPPQWRCIVDYSGFSCHGKQKICFPPMGIKYARLVVTSHCCENKHKWNMEPLQGNIGHGMVPRPHGVIAPYSMITPGYRVMTCQYDQLPSGLRASFVLAISQPYAISCISIKFSSSTSCKGDLTVLTSTREAKDCFGEVGTLTQQHLSTANDISIHFPERVVLYISLDIKNIESMTSSDPEMQDVGGAYPAIVVDTISCSSTPTPPLHVQ